MGGSIISSAPSDVHFIKSAKHFKIDTECYVLRNENGDVIVGFRGSESFEDILTDIDVIPIKYPLFTGDPGLLNGKQPYVNNGFWQAYNAVREELIDHVRNALGRNGKIYITGHSLGGALSVHAAYDLSMHFDSAIRLYTYGCPRVGNKAFCKEIEDRVHTIELYVNTEDPVPFVPPIFLNISIKKKKYAHPDGIRYFDKNGHLQPKLPIGKVALDIFGDHGIRSYIEKIEKYT